jgi:hypothetical protein
MNTIAKIGSKTAGGILARSALQTSILNRTVKEHGCVSDWLLNGALASRLRVSEHQDSHYIRAAVSSAEEM